MTDADTVTPQYPWHDALWAATTADLGRLPHALLLQGAPGLGKQAFAQRLTASLLCAQPGANAMACGRCHGCHLLAAGNHPDFMLLVPAEDKRSIVIDQVRELGTFFALRPHTATRKVALLTPADGMNLSAANSLLKILEEPPLGSVLLLVANQPARLPATIRSRCQRVQFAVPEREQALDWLGQQAGPNAALLLDLAGGAPLQALNLAKSDFPGERATLLRDLDQLLGRAGDPLACAQHWKGVGAATTLTWLMGFVSDLLRCSMLAEGSGRCLNPEAAAFLIKHKKVLYLNKLFIYLDVIYKYKNMLYGGSLDELLLLEDALIRWRQMGRELPTIKIRLAS